jgi:hypothetical protein
MVLEIPVIDDDTIIAMAAFGAGLTATGVALGAAETAESVSDWWTDKKDDAGNVVQTVVKVAKAVFPYLPLGGK